MGDLVIITGIPGSGKTFMREQLRAYIQKSYPGDIYRPRTFEIDFLAFWNEPERINWILPESLLPYFNELLQTRDVILTGYSENLDLFILAAKRLRINVEVYIIEPTLNEEEYIDRALQRDRDEGRRVHQREHYGKFYRNFPESQMIIKLLNNNAIYTTWENIFSLLKFKF